MRVVTTIALSYRRHAAKAGREVGLYNKQNCIFGRQKI